MSTEQSSYDSNMKKFGWADYAKPASIDIYPKDFESKQSVIDILDNYNEAMNAAGEEDKVVSYTDIVGALMSSVTTIVNMISYVLMAFNEKFNKLFDAEIDFIPYRGDFARGEFNHDWHHHLYQCA